MPTERNEGLRPCLSSGILLRLFVCLKPILLAANVMCIRGEATRRMKEISPRLPKVFLTVTPGTIFEEGAQRRRDAEGC